jgi:Mg2+ and Co2+ transporter CorA
LFSNNNNNNKDEDPKLGIDIGKMLEPLTPEQAQELRAEASEMIADKVAKGIDDIQDLRKQLTREVEKERNQRLMKSERDAAQASKRLLQKIDSLTSDFMSTSESMRKSTKLAAAADRANEGKGVELGSWGSLGGVSVATGGGLLGSVASSEATTTRSSTTTLSTMSDNEESVETAPKENRIIMIADPSQVC